MRIGRGDIGHHELEVARQQILIGLPDALVGHMQKLHLGVLLDHPHTEIGGGTSAGRAKGDARWFASRRLDQLVKGLRRDAGIHHQHQVAAHALRHRRQITCHIKTQARKQVGIDGDRGTGGDQQGMPIRGSTRHDFGADVAAGAGAVIHQKRLPEGLAQRLRHQSRIGIGATTRGGWHHDAYRLAWPGLLLLCL